MLRAPSFCYSSKASELTFSPSMLFLDLNDFAVEVNPPLEAKKVERSVPSFFLKVRCFRFGGRGSLRKLDDTRLL